MADKHPIISLSSLPLMSIWVHSIFRGWELNSNKHRCASDFFVCKFCFFWLGTDEWDYWVIRWLFSNLWGISLKYSIMVTSLHSPQWWIRVHFPLDVLQHVWLFDFQMMTILTKVRCSLDGCLLTAYIPPLSVK